MRMVRDAVTDRLVRSVALWNAVAEIESYRSAKTVMAFVGFKGEPDTDALFSLIAADGKRLLLPRVENGEIVVCAGDSPLIASAYGVLEPTGEALPYDAVDFVIVPGLAFTIDGDRLGYGGGFYDQLLQRVTVPNVGVCFEEQLVEELPIDDWDVRVQMVVTA